MRGVRGGGSVPVPKGWETVSFFSRLTTNGMCAHDKLIDGTLSLKDVFDMHRQLDFKDYVHLKSLEMAKKQNGRNR